MTKNNHWVPAFLTSPWIYRENGTSRPMLRYYDFKTREFGEASARRLFAGRNALADRIEQRIADLIEAPLGQAVSRIRKGEALDIKADAEWRSDCNHSPSAPWRIES